MPRLIRNWAGQVSLLMFFNVTEIVTVSPSFMAVGAEVEAEISCKNSCNGAAATAFFPSAY